MNSQHVLVIDGSKPGSSRSLPRGKLLSTQALHEYSTIIWLVDGLEKELPSYATVQGSLDQSLNKRLLQIKEWVHEGHTLIVVGPTAEPVHHLLPNGTAIWGRVDAFYPLNLLQKDITTGKLEAITTSPVESTIHPFLQSMSYRATLSAKGLNPLLFAQRAGPGEKFIVGGYIQEGKGKVFFIPDCKGGNHNIDDAFYRALAKLPALLATNREELPQWTREYKSSVENRILTKVADLKKQRDKLDAQLGAMIAKLQAEEEFKQLISGTGSAFVVAVSKALEELGLRLTDGPDSRADLIGACESRYLAIEAKGIDGPVKERQYRQVERWMAELNSALHSEPEDIKGDPEIAKYAECVKALALFDYDGSDAKGVLVVATFRHTPLHERTDPDFPDTVIRIIQRTDTCAMTGLQLFGLIIEARSDPSSKPQLRSELMATRGVLARAGDWTGYLTRTPNQLDPTQERLGETDKLECTQ